MLDFDLVRRRRATLAALVEPLNIDDLRELTNEMIDRQLELMDGCVDADVAFVPDDPEANDRYAADESDVKLAWTLGHVIVHVTASSEEKAFLAAEQARGISREGRSRYETPWETVETMDQVRRRLEESRRMRLASLDMWPEEPNLDLTILYKYVNGPINAKARFVLGLMHDDDHLGQIAAAPEGGQREQAQEVVDAGLESPDLPRIVHETGSRAVRTRLPRPELVEPREPLVLVGLDRPVGLLLGVHAVRVPAHEQQVLHRCVLRVVDSLTQERRSHRPPIDTSAHPAV